MKARPRVLLLKAEKILGRDAVRSGFYGQEINITTYNLCRINMFLYDIGFDKFDIACEDTLTAPQHWVVSARNENRLVFKTFDKAIAANPSAKPIFHSDRGFQYTSKMFKKKLVKQEMRQSMSRVGHCIDNGPTEGFWGIIKAEMYQMYEITDESSLRFAIKDYIRFYSEERPQDRYCCKTPLEVRQEALKSDIPVEYPIPENKRIKKYKEKWCA